MRRVIAMILAVAWLSACGPPPSPGDPAISEPAVERVVRHVRMLALFGSPRPVHVFGRPIDGAVDGITLPPSRRIPGSFVVRIRGDVHAELADELRRMAGGGEWNSSHAQSYFFAEGVSDAAARAVARHPEVISVSANARLRAYAATVDAQRPRSAGTRH